jgi:hypothetical protein
MLNQATTASVLQFPVGLIAPNLKQPRKRFAKEEPAVIWDADLDVQVDWEDYVDKEVEVV